MSSRPSIEQTKSIVGAPLFVNVKGTLKSSGDLVEMQIPGCRFGKGAKFLGLNYPSDDFLFHEVKASSFGQSFESIDMTLVDKRVDSMRLIHTLGRSI